MKEFARNMGLFCWVAFFVTSTLGLAKEQVPQTSLEITAADCIAAYERRYEEATETAFHAYWEDCKKNNPLMCLLMPITGPFDQIRLWLTASPLAFHIDRVLSIIKKAPTDSEYQEAQRWFFERIQNRVIISEVEFASEILQIKEKNQFCVRVWNGGFDNQGPPESPIRRYYQTDGLKKRPALDMLERSLIQKGYSPQR